MHFLQRLKLRRGTPHLLILYRVILMGIRFLSHLVTAIHSVCRKWLTSNNFFYLPSDIKRWISVAAVCTSHYCNVIRLARITANLWHGLVGNNSFFFRCSCWRSTLPWMPTPRPFATTSTHGRCGCPRRCLSFLTSPTGSPINMSTWNHPSPTYLVTHWHKGSSIHWTHSK